ncbi:MAG: NAD(P)H-quinone oxidoreductase [Alphaproteobacteria bacterium]|nr:NAD(P)H-quinone oxidoreductase [Alphaproteobacteria bacterium]
MRVADCTAPGGPEVLKLATRPTPRPSAGEVLIEVAAAGVNRPDVMQRRGNYAPPPGVSTILGLEVSGTIVACGDGIGDALLGREVCALLAGGGYAEYCAVPYPQCLPVPRGLSLVEAAGLPETFCTVWANVFERGGLKSGETFLVHGGASGIGTAAIQLAHAFGARVFTTVGSAAKQALCHSLGAERAINYREEDFRQVVKELTGGAGVNLIMDMVGGTYIERNIDALAVDGRLVCIAFLAGSRVDVDFHPMMVKRITITGSTLRPRSVEQKGAIARALQQHVWPLLESGRVRPVIDSTFPLAQAALAHAKIDADHAGKIILTL